MEEKDRLQRNKIVQFLNNKIKNFRDYEYLQALKYFKECQSIVDVGCGTGIFLEMWLESGKKDACGVDINPDCVELCQSKGLNVKIGDALQIPFGENEFDGAYLSHVLHIFQPAQAAHAIQELIRVVKPNGVIAIATVPFYERFFFDSADMRPYPPEAIRLFFMKPHKEGHGAPTFHGLPQLKEEAIWMRRPALIELNFQGSHQLFNICQFLNRLQYALFLRKYWTFNGYIIKLRNSK